MAVTSRMTVMRALVLLLLALAAFMSAPVSVVEAQPRRRPPPAYVQRTPPDAAEGMAILERSRNIGLAGPYYLEFELRVLPRRGAETSRAGRWFGQSNATGPVTRVELADGASPNAIVIIQGGRHPAAWFGETGGAFEELAGSRAFESLGDSHLSAVDLQTPFMYWSDHAYEGLERFRGRPTHVFLLYPPDSEAGRYPEIGGARVYIDTAYGAISQAQWLDPDGAALKTITILDLKRIGERWIVKSFEVRDERTRDKTRFVVRAAALDLSFPPELFHPGEVAQAAAFVVPDERVTRVR